MNIEIDYHVRDNSASDFEDAGSGGPFDRPRRRQIDVIVEAMLRPTLKTQMALMAKSIAGRMRRSD